MSAAARMVDMIDRFTTSLGLHTGTPADSGIDARIDERWELLRANGIDRPGLAFAAWLDLGLVGGVLPPLLANCRDVGALIDALARFHPIWGDDEVVIEHTGSGWCAVELRGPAGAAVHRDTTDAFFATLARMLGALTDPPVRPARLSIRTVEADGYEGIAATLRFGAPRDRLEFAPQQLRSTIAAADPAISTILEAYAQSEVAGRGRDLVRRVRAEIRRDPSRPSTLAAVAGELALGQRTLQQRLLEQGTSFAEVADDERRTFALALLADDELSVSTVAHRAGFRSIEGFSRAVRRWTGVSPTAWRTRGSS